MVYTVEGKPESIQDVRLIQPLDRSAIKLDSFSAKGQQVRIDPPLTLDVEFGRETAMLTVREPLLGIDAFGETRDMVEASVRDEFDTLWRFYASAPDADLAPDALELKSRLKRRLRLSADAAEA